MGDRGSNSSPRAWSTLLAALLATSGCSIIRGLGSEPTDDPAATADGGTDAGALDVGPDAGIEPGPDANMDAGYDGGIAPGPDAALDAGRDAGVDAGASDAGPQPCREAYRTVGVGWQHTLAIRHDGTLWAWGKNVEGQVGIGTQATAAAPHRIGAGVDWRAVAGGEYHSLAIRDDGSLWSWGRNVEGQLGDRSRTDANRTRPGRVGHDRGWVEVAAGKCSSYARRANGDVWAWGCNSHGQHGRGDGVNPRHEPAQSTILSIVALSVRGNHALALSATGRVWAWGYSANGECGVAQSLPVSTPRQVTIPTSTVVVAIAAGLRDSLALDADGVLWAWGSNNSAQLGLGEAPGSAPRPSPVAVPPVAPATSWTGIAAAGAHSLALDERQALWGWGQNIRGQLGLGTNTPSNVTSPQPSVDAPAGGYGFVTGHWRHSVALRSVDQTLWIFGDNGDGQMGQGTAGGYVARPTQVRTCL